MFILVALSACQMNTANVSIDRNTAIENLLKKAEDNYFDNAKRQALKMGVESITKKEAQHFSKCSIYVTFALLDDETLSKLIEMDKNNNDDMTIREFNILFEKLHSVHNHQKWCADIVSSIK